MRNVATLPKSVLILETLGVLLMIAALMLINQWLPAPEGIADKTLATILFIAGVVLMLPAAWLMMWRTAKAMAPQLFNHTHTKK